MRIEVLKEIGIMRIIIYCNSFSTLLNVLLTQPNYSNYSHFFQIHYIHFF